MKLLRFLKSKTFFANLAIALVLVSLLFWGFNRWLHSYTHYGENIEVPDLNRLSVIEAGEALEDVGLIYSVLDSAEFNPEFPRGSVLAQYPESGSQVKIGREILLTINPLQPKKIALPDLVEKTKRRAIYDLESKGFKVGELEYVPDIAKEAVVNVKVNGKNAHAGMLLDKGTEVVLVLGQGLGKTLVRVPYLKRMTLEEAEARLRKSSLNRGAIVYDENIVDTAAALIYEQYPAPTFEAVLNMGQQVDIRLTNDYTKLPSDTLEYLIYEIPDSTSNAATDTTAIDTTGY